MTWLFCILYLWTAPAAFAAPDAAEIKERKEIDANVHRLWSSKDFVAIDALAQNYRSKTALTTSGYWKLSFFYEAFDKLTNLISVSDFPSGYEWKMLEEWRSEYPRSPTAIIVNAQFLIRQAERIAFEQMRSNIYDKSPDLPVDLLQAARDLLVKNAEATSHDPHWHTTMMRIRRLEKEPIDELLSAYTETLDASPDYTQTHFEMFGYLFNLWYPDMRRIEAIANTIAGKTQHQNGSAVYARLYESAYSRIHQKQPFSLKGINWNKFRGGYERIIADFPSAWNTNHFAYFSCIARDHDQAHKLFPSVKIDIIREAWGDSIVYEQCKSWATAP